MNDRDDSLARYPEDVGLKDFKFGVTGVSIMVVVAILLALFG